jgi:glycine/D-amino acid oxidase-like deaminating enzyme
MKYEVFWKNPGYQPRPKLRQDIDCDYLIVGGGVTGVSVAYFLAKFGAENARGEPGQTIVLIEKKEIASGATGKAAGTLVLRGEYDVAEVIRKHGTEKGAIFWREVHEGLTTIKKLINEENIACDAEPQDTLYCDFKHTRNFSLHAEYEAEKSIETTTKFLNTKELKEEINTDLFAHGILSANHGLSVNPLQLTQNLSKVIERYGVKVYENTAMLHASGNVARTAHGNISFKKMIVAIDSDYPSKEIRHLKSTIVITRPLSADELAKTKLGKKKIVFDSKNSYDYFKVTKEGRMLFGFGNLIVRKKHDKIEPHRPHLKTIRVFMKRLFPYLDLEPEYAWAGSFGITDDYDPLIKFDGATVAIAGAGTQVTSVMAGKHVARKLLGQPSSLEEFFKD